MPSNRSINQLPPTMTAPWTLPAPLPDITGGETNLLHRSAWSDPANPLRVEFKPWYEHPVGSGKTESVSVFLDDDESNEIGYREWTLPMSPDDHFVEINAEKLPPGEHQLSFIMTNYIGAPARSHPFTVTVDKQAPQLNPSSQLIFPDEVSPPNAITAAYLADPDNQDQVKALVPDYLGKKVGDVLTWYFEQSPGGRDVAGSKILEPKDIKRPVQATFTGDLLRKANGEFYATYRVRDRAGNGDDVLSEDQKLMVNIRPPAQRKFPTVKQATSTPSGTGVLDPFLGTAGVSVEVAATEIDPFEEVTVDFIGLGGEDGIGSVKGVKPVTPGGLEFHIPFSVVAPNIPVEGDGRSVQIRYWAGHDTQHSEVYTLKINEMGTNLGQVQCPEADIGQPATLSKLKVAASGANITINKWAYHENTQLINVWAMTGGIREDFLEGEEAPITGDSKKFTTPLPKSYVAALALDSIFTVYASVSFDQGQSYRPFQSMALKVVE